MVSFDMSLIPVDSPCNGSFSRTVELCELVNTLYSESSTANGSDICGKHCFSAGFVAIARDVSCHRVSCSSATEFLYL